MPTDQHHHTYERRATTHTEDGWTAEAIPAGSALIEELRSAPKLPTPEVARAIRRQAKVTQSRLAEELGVHPVTVARWECGTRRPRGAVMRAYAELLGELGALA